MGKPCKYDIVLALSVLLCLAGGYHFAKDRPYVVDEYDHVNQIIMFLKGDLRVYPTITVIPGFHLLYAAAGGLFHSSTLPFFRLVSTIISLASVVLFFLLARRIDGGSARIKCLQYLVVPVTFPFMFLVYTDVLSMLLVLAMLYLLVGRHYSLSGAAGIMSLLIRQNNVVWLLFACAYVAWEGYGFRFDWGRALSYLEKCAVYFAGILAFVVFSLLMGGFVIFDASHHPAFSIHLGNVYFLLFVFFFVFLPLNVSNLPHVFRLLNSPKSAAYVLLGFLFYMATFVSDNPYNLPPYMDFLRNLLLIPVTSNGYLKALCFIPVAYSALSLGVTKLHRRHYRLIYPITLLLLAFSWLIEERYYMVPFSLFILFRKSGPPWVEHSLVSVNAAFAFFLYWGVVTQRFYI